MAIFTLTSGNDSLVGTSADDLFNATPTTLNAGDIINDNGGNDALVLTEAGTYTVLTAQAFGNVQSVIGSTGDDILILSGSRFSTIDLGTGNNTLKYSGAANISAKTLTNVQTLEGLSGGQTLTIKSTQIGGAASLISTIKGGVGINTLRTTDATLDLAGVTLSNIQRLSSSANIDTNFATFTSANVSGAKVAISAGSGNDTIHLLVAQLASLNAIDGSGGNNTLILDAAGTYDLTSLTSGITNIQNITGTAGDDTLVVNSSMLTPVGTLDLGAGVNLLQTNTTTLNVSAKTLVNVPTLNSTVAGTTFTVAAGQLASNNGTLTSIAGTGAGNTVSTAGTSLDMSATALSNIQQLLSTSSVGTSFKIGITGLIPVTLTGGSGDDIFHVASAQMPAAGTITVNGGAGTNSVALDTGGSYDLTTLAALTNIQKITTTATATTVIDTSAAHAIIGGLGNDTFTGGGGADVFTGGGGADSYKDTAANFSGVSITDLGLDDTLNLTDVALAGATFSISGNTLKIMSSGATVAQLSLAGTFAQNFALTSDGATGILVKSIPVVIVSPAPPAPAPITADGSGKALSGSTTNDVFVGSSNAAAVDTVLQTGSKWAQTTLTANADGTITVTGANGTDQLSSIERVRFDDGVVLFNLPASTKIVAGLYKSMFNRLGDENGLNFYAKSLTAADTAATLKTISTAFLQSPEAASINTMSNQQFVTLMYQNALGRAPDSPGLQFYLDTLAHGSSRADTMLSFAQSTESLTLLGQYTQTGIFSPYVDATLS